MSLTLEPGAEHRQAEKARGINLVALAKPYLRPDRC